MSQVIQMPNDARASRNIETQISSTVVAGDLNNINKFYIGGHNKTQIDVRSKKNGASRKRNKLGLNGTRIENKNNNSLMMAQK